MKNHAILTIVVSSALLAAAQAGTEYTMAPPASIQAQAPMKVPALCDCFKESTASVSLYAAAILPNGNGELDDSLGGGLALDYFFSTHVGIEVDATWGATDGTVHIFTGSVVLRYPIEHLCLAPYIFGGGGVQTDGSTQGVSHVGAGIDYRISHCIGIFADARYTWTQDTQDYTLIRAGVRMAF